MPLWQENRKPDVWDVEPYQLGLMNLPTYIPKKLAKSQFPLHDLRRLLRQARIQS